MHAQRIQERLPTVTLGDGSDTAYLAPHSHRWPHIGGHKVTQEKRCQIRFGKDAGRSETVAYLADWRFDASTPTTESSAPRRRRGSFSAVQMLLTNPIRRSLTQIHFPKGV